MRHVLRRSETAPIRRKLDAHAFADDTIAFRRTSDAPAEARFPEALPSDSAAQAVEPW